MPDAGELLGIDPAPRMVEAARYSAPRDPRVHFEIGVAERLPCTDATYDLVVSTTSFDHWADQRAGLAECARVMSSDGRLVLVDQFSNWLWVSTLTTRRGHARTVAAANRLVHPAGLRVLSWHRLYAVIIRALVAARQTEPDTVGR